MNRLKKIIFRVDCNKHIGFGHISRCLNLSKLFIKKKVKIFFIIKNFGDKYYPNIPKEIKIIKINKDLKKKKEGKIIKDIFYKEQCDLVILDIDYLYNYSKNENNLLILELSEIKKKIICWDNLHGKNVNFLATYRPYPKFINLGNINKNSKKIVGLNYLYFSNDVKKKNIKKIVKNIAISLGGTNTLKKIKYIINTIIDFNLNVNIYIFIVNKNDYLILKKNFLVGKKNIKVLFRSKNINNIYRKLDLAIVSGGISKYEAFIHKIPNMIINLKQQQKNINSKIQKKKLGIIVNNLSLFDKYFWTLVNNFELRRSISTNCQKLRKGYNENIIYKKFEKLIK